VLQRAIIAPAARNTPSSSQSCASRRGEEADHGQQPHHLVDRVMDTKCADRDQQRRSGHGRNGLFPRKREVPSPTFLRPQHRENQHDGQHRQRDDQQDLGPAFRPRGFRVARP
jgi:hypothetical protein